MQALWIVLATFFFSCMGVCVKYASVEFNAAELVFYRGVFGMVFLAVMARTQGMTLRTAYPRMHAWRSLVGVVSLMGWFYAIGHLPLATSITLNYMSSVWIAAFLVGGALFAWRPGAAGASHGPALQGPLVLTVLAGFAGVVMLLQPSIGPDQVFAALIGLLAGLSAAFAYMQVVTLSRVGEPETRVVFYFSVGSAVAGLAGMLAIGFTIPHNLTAMWLWPIGLFACLGQLCMTRAYSRASGKGGTLVVANLQYSGIVFSAIFGAVLFGDRIPLLGWLGMATIIASGVAATLLRSRAAPDAPGEEHDGS